MFIEKVELEKEKFRQKYLKNSKISKNEFLIDFNELSEDLNPNSSLYYKEKLQNEFFPFLQVVIQKICDNFINTDEQVNFQKLQILKKAFIRVRQIIKTNKERIDILGSDYLSESEDEEQIRNCFSKEALEIFDSEKISLNKIIMNEQAMDELEKQLLTKFSLENKIKFFEVTNPLK